MEKCPMSQECEHTNIDEETRDTDGRTAFKINRREFINRVSTTGLLVIGSAVGAVLLHDKRSGREYFREEREEEEAVTLRSYRVEFGSSDTQMVIVRGKDKDKDTEKMVRAALTEMGGVGKFIQKGDVVVVKPNVAFDRPPALGATTNPEVLKALVLLCREAGAKKVIVADNPINQPEGCFHKTGIKQAAEEAGAVVVYPRPDAFQLVKIGGVVLSRWTFFYEPFRHATKVIGVAPCKDHNLCSASMTMKNWYGLLGGRRNQLHQKIHDVIAEFTQMMQPTFVILDATRILMRNGPTGGSLSDVKDGNTIVCGLDMVSVDAFGYEKLLERDPANLQYLWKAEQRGLGNPRWRSVNYKEVSV